MEKYSKDLYESISGLARVDLFANRLGNKFLPIFLAAAAVRIIVTGRRYDIIHFGDGLLAVLIPLVHALGKATVTITVHGLDVTYDNPVYQRLVLPRLYAADRIVAISRNTRALCLARGIPEDKIVVIPNGVSLKVPEGIEPARPTGLPSVSEHSKILCTLGRLVKRKGHEWFVREVMPLLDRSYIYLIAGDGPEKQSIEHAITESGLGNRVILLGRIDETEKEWLFRNASLFIMPNIPIAGDVEGFGLVLTEAASRGLMSVASEIDGIPDAVIPGETGVLARPQDARSFIRAIESARPDRDRVASAVAWFDWKRIARLYLDEMKKAYDGIPARGLERRRR
jgi:glycosyltransferase involved in cell wall biosynthesis